MIELSRKEAIEILEEVKELDDSIYQFNPKYMQALDNAIADEKKIDQVIRDYEKLCNSMSEQGLDGVACTKKIDEFCIDTMRGLLSEYYAERIGYGTK